jgi:hypothetical protein
MRHFLLVDSGRRSTKTLRLAELSPACCHYGPHILFAIGLCSAAVVVVVPRLKRRNPIRQCRSVCGPLLLEILKLSTPPRISMARTNDS